MKFGMSLTAAVVLIAVLLAVAAAQPSDNAEQNDAAAKTESSTTAILNIPEDWQAEAEPELETDLERAEMLPVEDLGTTVYGLDVGGTNLVPNPDGKSYDVLVWYRKQYRQETRAYIVDLGSGEVTKQDFKVEEDRARVEMALTWFGNLAFDGKLYGAITDQHTWGSGGIMLIYRYDPATNQVELYKKIKGHGGERNPTVLAPTGWIYGAGSWLGEEDTLRRASAYGFNPQTGEFKDFGAIGPKIGGTAYGYDIGACDTHIYVACGKMPWYLVAINVETGEESVLLEAPEGAFGLKLNGSQYDNFGGAVACTQQTTDKSTRKFYWLYHGKAIPKGTAGWAMDDSCPWPEQVRASAPVLTRPAAPEIHVGQLYPDENDRAVLWWRPGTPNRDGSKPAWRRFVLEGVGQHPLAIHRLHELPDGRLFGSGHGSKGRFLFDPRLQQVTHLGNGGASLYAISNRGDRLFFSGYAGGPIFEFDPNRPWNVEKGGPPGSRVITNSSPEISSPQANPRKVHADPDAVLNLTRVKKMLSATTAADGRVYFGGKGQRDYEGGGLAWYDPESGQVGGMWEPFVEQEIGWLTTAVKDRYVIIGTDGGNVFIYDTDTQRLLSDNTFKPVPGSDKSGPLLEVAPGRMLGVTWQGSDQYRGVLYGVEVPSGKVFFRKQIPWGVPFAWREGTGQWDFKKGPDGFIWATLENGKGRTALVRIDPRDANVQVLGRITPSGKMAFAGRDLYLSGTEQLRRLPNIVPLER